MKYDLSTLKNGLKVLTVKMADRNSASVAVWVKVGARYENSSVAGMSHFLEHMMFKGTKKRHSRDIKRSIEGIGGVLNAFTGEESTCYFSKLLNAHYSKAMEVFSDMILNSTLPAEEFKKEKKVILEEIKMYHDLPAHRVHELLQGLVWKGNTLSRSIAGSLKSVEGLTRDQMVQFKKKYYQASNLLISVSGDLDHEEVVKNAEKYFGKAPRGKSFSFKKFTPQQTKAQYVMEDKKTEQAHLVLGVHGLERSHVKRYQLSLLHVILGANMSSRLFDEVREKRGLAYEIKSGLISYSDTGAFTISAGVEPGKAVETVKVVLNELRKLKTKKVSNAELKRAKDYFMSQIYLGIEDTLDHLLWVGDRVLNNRSLPDLKNIKKNIEKVTPEHILHLSKKLFLTKHLNFALVGPLPKEDKEQIGKMLKI